MRRAFPLLHLGLLGLIGLFLLPKLSCNTDRPRRPSVVLQRGEHDSAITLLERIDEFNEHGKYAEAIPLAEELLGLIEREKGPAHQGVAACLNILGGLYDSIGDYEKAEATLKRALAITEKMESQEGPAVATSLGVLAKVYMNKGDYLAAVPLARRALEIRTKRQRDDPFIVSTSLNTLGEIYLNLHAYEKAEPLFKRAIEIRKEHGNAHSLLIALNNLSQLYYQVQDYDSARILAAAALELGENALGRDHLHVGETLTLLGKIDAAVGQDQEAFYYLKRAQEIHLKAIDHMKGFTSEKQRLRFLGKMEEDLHIFLSLIFGRLPQSSEARREALNTVLKRKGIGLELQKQFQEALISGDRRMSEIFERLSEVRTSLSILAFSGPGKEGIAAYRENINALSAAKEQLEIQLSRLSKPYEVYLKKAEANCQTIAAVLPQNTALIEFVQVRPFRFGPNSKNKWAPARYYALLLFAGRPENVRLIDVGPAEPIDTAISSFKEAISKPEAPLRDRVLEMARRLYGRVFSYVERDLGEIREVFLSPDGDLSLIPFEVFLRPDGRFLVETFTFNYLACGRDLLGFGASPARLGKSVIIANPDFDLGAGQREKILADLTIERIRYSAVAYSRDLRHYHFKPLPGTEDEADVISDILGRDNVVLLKGKLALEELLMQVDSPKVLHLATHGFFLSDQEAYRLFGDNYPRGLSIRPMNPTELVHMENPLLRSGLVLAGANQLLKHGRRSGGIVTAEEVLGLNLRGTEMVVLSACETGLGQVKVGEGVFGLRRAFTQAGARSLVTSMWSVPDLETSELMGQFYRNIPLAKLNRAQALRQAMLEEMRVVKGRYGNPDPLYWGAFVFLGEP